MLTDSERFRFDAFICHSTRADGEVVAALRRELHMHTRRLFGVRRLHLFQDRSDLGSSATLWSTLEDHLQASRTLMVILTPESGSSAGMVREIEWWLENRSLDTIHLVALSGDVIWDEGEKRFRAGGAVPKPLQAAFSEEPFFFDLRGYRGQRREADTFTSDTFWSLLAALSGKTADMVRRQDRTRRRLEVGIAVVSVLALVGAVSYGINRQIAFALEEENGRNLATTIEADRIAATSAAFLDDDPHRSANLAKEAQATRTTTNAVRQSHRVAWRWPFLQGLWQIGAPPNVAFNSGAPWRVFLCAGSDGWVIDLRKSGDQPQQRPLALSELPRYGRAVCRVQRRPDQSDHLVTLEFAPIGDEGAPVDPPGPTVYSVANGKTHLLREGGRTDTAADVCSVKSLEGFVFTLKGEAWLCRAGVPTKISTEGFFVGPSGTVVASKDGSVVAVTERALKPRPESASRRNPFAFNVVVVSPGNGERRVVPVDFAPGDRIHTLEPGGKQAFFKGYDRFGTINLQPGQNAGHIFDQAGDAWDVDAFALDMASGWRWLLRSTPYSGSERERSYAEMNGADGDLEFERFGSFREVAVLAHVPDRNRLIVASRSGQVELYDVKPGEDIVNRISGPRIIRFETCDPIEDDDGKTWMLALSPAGAGVAFDPDNPERRIPISSQGPFLNIYRPDSPDQIVQILAPLDQDWLLRNLQRRWALARTLKTGLNDIRMSANGAVVAGIDGVTGELVLQRDGRPVRVRLDPEQNDLLWHRAFQISPSGRFVSIPTQKDEIALYEIDWLSGRASGPFETFGSFLQFSPDEKLVAIAQDLTVVVKSLACVADDQCPEDLRRLETVMRAHNNGVQQMAFDRAVPVLYSAGNRRVAIHDLETAERLDVSMKLHRDTVESICALDGGGLLSLDQRRSTLIWRAEPGFLEKRLTVLSSLQQEQ